MKKFLPIILFVIGLGVVSAAIFFVLKGKKEDTDTEDTSALIEVSLSDRPIASLIPSEDGHWLKLIIEKIKIDAVSLDYELLYKLPDGRTQGVPGTVALKGQTSLERDLLLGSESSGKFRYDEGVEAGSLTLRFRNDRGKLIAKFSTDFSLLNGTKTLTNPDGSFLASLDKSSSEYFVVMETFGLPEMPEGSVISGPYGVFSSAPDDLGGSVDSPESALRWTGSKWDDSPSEATGIFVATSSE